MTITDANATLHDGNYSVVVSNDFGSEETNVSEFLVINQNAINQGLVAWYPFDGNASDMSGNGNHGTVNGATLGTDRQGVVGKAYSFDGVDDWIEVPPSSQLSIQENLSVSFWFELNSLSDGNFLQKGNSNNGWEWELVYSGSLGPVSTIHQHDGSSPHTNVFSNKSLSLNRFSNLISVFSANNFLKLYIDGRLVGSSSSFSASFGGGNSPLYIGARKGWASHPDPFRPFKGSIDDIRIYNRALSAGEVQALYNLGQ